MRGGHLRYSSSRILGFDSPASPLRYSSSIDAVRTLARTSTRMKITMILSNDCQTDDNEDKYDNEEKEEKEDNDDNDDPLK